MHVSPGAWNKVGGAICTIRPSSAETLRNFGNKLHKLASILPDKGPEQIYLKLVQNWSAANEVVIGSTKSSAQHPIVEDQWPCLGSFVESAMYLDSVTYLPGDILVKVDRAAMSSSLETRIPYLDHQVFEFAWELQPGLKVHEREGKWILKQLLYKYVPRALVARPKMGFGVPLDNWLRGPLRDWAEALLDKARLGREGYLRSGPIRDLWSQHLSGSRNWHHHLWDVLMFQAWLEEAT
jgi:asparagine synthase (glutamine-hydrolysing)